MRYSRAIGIILVAAGLGFLCAQLFSPGRFVRPIREITEAVPPSAAPVYFESNQGQVDSSILFLLRNPGNDVRFTRSGPIFCFRTEDGPAVLRISAGDGSTTANVVGVDRMTRSNYLRGRLQNRWITNVPGYAAIRYARVYPGIDWLFYERDGMLEYDFVVSPHVNPSEIEVEVSGADNLQLDATGDLIVSIGATTLRHHKPISYQEIAGKRTPVASSYVIAGDRIAFKIGDYDSTHPLIIDPILTYSTYFGGDQADFGKGIAVDSAGFVYLTGTTLSTNFPVAAALEAESAGDFDIVVTKLDPVSNSLVYSTYIGGSGTDSGNSLVIDKSGAVYVTGNTDSRDLPVAGAFQNTYGGGAFDAFALKLSPDGDALEYATFLGGAQEDLGTDLKVDVEGSVYITGRTASEDFPTARAIQPRYGGGVNDAFITKLSPDGSSLVYSTYFGESGVELGSGIDIDNEGHAYVTGTKLNLTTQDIDLFAARLSADGSAFSYNQIIGTTSSDHAHDIAVNSANEAFLTGITLVGPNGGDDAFVIRLDGNGDIIYAGFLGGSRKDFGNRIAIDGEGHPVLVGRTASPDFPLVQPFQRTIGGGFDGFVARLDEQGQIVHSSFLGGSGGSVIQETGDNARALAIDSQGNIYVTGHTLSTDFPTVDSFQHEYGGGEADGFITRISKMPTSVRDPSASRSFGFDLRQNYPNPFNPSTRIGFDVPVQQAVELAVFDILGRRIATLIDRQQYAAGYYEVEFNAEGLASGVYVYRLQVGQHVLEKKMVLMH